MQKTHFSPYGDQSPLKGTNVGAVHQPDLLLAIGFITAWQTTPINEMLPFIFWDDIGIWSLSISRFETRTGFFILNLGRSRRERDFFSLQHLRVWDESEICKLMSQGRARKNEHNSHENSRNRKFSLCSALAWILWNFGAVSMIRVGLGSGLHQTFIPASDSTLGRVGGSHSDRGSRLSRQYKCNSQPHEWITDQTNFPLCHPPPIRSHKGSTLNKKLAKLKTHASRVHFAKYTLGK